MTVLLGILPVLVGGGLGAMVALVLDKKIENRW